MGCDPAAAVSSVMMNLKGFSPACCRCYIRRTGPGGGGDWRERCCRAAPPPPCLCTWADSETPAGRRDSSQSFDFLIFFFWGSESAAAAGVRVHIRAGRLGGAVRGARPPGLVPAQVRVGFLQEVQLPPTTARISRGCWAGFQRVKGNPESGPCAPSAP